MTREQLYNYKTEIYTDMQKMERLYAAARTNHILHLLLSIFTGGLWLVIWLFVAADNTQKRRTLGKKIDESHLLLRNIDHRLMGV